ncbi:hypothetical protein [Deinococcus fonticola]|uniref:hypothetical protein n=1 Tax=Deinococcus fonticola TaxID=2528713 RepID=UPI00107548EF|nr:hypothetical protein [Deinococcus fonticola]
MRLYRGDTPYLHYPLTLDDQPLTPEQQAALAAGTYTLQFRRSPSSNTTTAFATFLRLIDSTDPETGLTGFGPLFKLTAPEAAKLPLVCYADLQVTFETPDGPDVQTWIRFDVSVEGDVTR